MLSFSYLPFVRVRKIIYSNKWPKRYQKYLQIWVFVLSLLEFYSTTQYKKTFTRNQTLDHQFDKKLKPKKNSSRTTSDHSNHNRFPRPIRTNYPQNETRDIAIIAATYISRWASQARHAEEEALADANKQSRPCMPTMIRSPYMHARMLEEEATRKPPRDFFPRLGECWTLW